MTIRFSPTPLSLLAVAVIASATVRGLLLRNYVLIGDDSFGYLVVAEAIARGDWSAPGLRQHLGEGLLLLPFIHTFGGHTGAWTLALIASVLPAFPAFMLSRLIMPAWAAAFAAVAVIWFPVFGGVLGFGFAPLLGLTAALYGFYFSWRYFDTHSNAHLIAIFVSSASLALLSQSLIPVFGIAMAVLWTSQLKLHARLDDLMPYLALAVTAAGGVLLFQSEILALSEGTVGLRKVSGVVISLAGAGVLWFYSRRLQRPEGRLFATIGVSSALLSILSATGSVWLAVVFNRAQYFAWAVLVIYAVHFATTYMQSWRVPSLAISALLVVLMLPLGFAWRSGFASQAVYRSTLTHDSLDVLRWSQTTLRPGTQVVIHPDSMAKYLPGSLEGIATFNKGLAQGYASVDERVERDHAARCLIEGVCVHTSSIQPRFAIVKQTPDAPTIGRPIVYARGDVVVLDLSRTVN